MEVVRKLALIYKRCSWSRIIVAIPWVGQAIHEFLMAEAEKEKALSKRELSLFKKIWDFNKDDYVFIICPELEEPAKRQEPEPQEFLYLGKYGDIDSLLVIYTSLNKIYPQLTIKFCTSKEFNNLPGNPYADNLILIGGPDYNQITRAFMDYTPFEFNKNDLGDTILKYKKTEQIFESKFTKQKEIEEVIDFGFFLKMPNPNNPNKKLIIINGIHTYGVYGAAKGFSLYDENEMNISQSNCKIVIDASGNDCNFAVILKVRAINKKIGIPIIKKEDMILL